MVDTACLRAQGVPVRLEIGAKDLEASTCVLAVRHNGAKESVPGDWCAHATAARADPGALFLFPSSAFPLCAWCEGVLEGSFLEVHRWFALSHGYLPMHGSAPARGPLYIHKGLLHGGMVCGSTVPEMWQHNTEKISKMIGVVLQAEMLARATAEFEACKEVANTWEEFMAALDRRHMCLAPW